ncbi:MAG: succinylglutamate desuccinylase, partial [Halorubrum sp.]
DTTVLSLHSTQSYAEPFAVIDSMDEVTRAVAPHLPVDAVIQTDAFTEGRLIEHPHTLEVEAGLQGSDAAADNAYWLTRAFLAATGVLPAPGAEGVVDAGGREDVEVFRLRDRIPKPEAEEYEVFARNFERVEAGDPFAAADGDPLRADEPFYPVLLSPYGYRDQFGYVADRVGTLE